MNPATPNTLANTFANTLKKSEDMGYETKVLLIALAKIVRKADTIKEIYETIEEMANAEGIILKPLDEK